MHDHTLPPDPELAQLILRDIDSFVPTQQQQKAILDRNFKEARRLGVNLDQYLYEIDNMYRTKLYKLAYT